MAVAQDNVRDVPYNAPDDVHQGVVVKTNSTLNIALQNQTSSSTVYAYITGLAIDNNNALFLLQADGKTPYYPSSPSSTLSPLGVNCAIALGAPGNTVTATIPHLAGARLWFSQDSTLAFSLNPGPALVEPSSTNKSDPNYNKYWDFCEFTFNSNQLFANISYVDFVCLPISLTLQNTSGGTQHVSGLPSNGLNTVCSGLVAQNAQDGAGWDQLVVTLNGANLRALSPNSGIAMNSSLFSGYYQPYVNAVWSQYTGNALQVDTQASFGTVSGTVSNGQLTFAGVGSYTQPSSADIFSCSSGPFSPTGNTEKDAITARLAASCNRSTLLLNVVHPDGESISNYYKYAITNHYSRICHSTNLDGRGYGFPYDDVSPSSSSSDQSGSISDPNPQLLTVAVGGANAFASKKREGGRP